MELPNVVTAARAWMALYGCQLNPVRSLVPPPLEPVTLRGGRALAIVLVLDCEESSFGPYRQLAIGFAARHRPWFSPPVRPLWFERRAGDFGYWIELLATSTEQTRQADVAHWGLPAVLADINIQLKRSRLKVNVAEQGAELLRFEMKRPGAGLPLHFPLRLYSRLGSEMARTEMSVDAVGREKSFLASATLTLERHEMVEKLRSVNIEHKDPLEARWYDSFRTRIDVPAARFRLK